VRILVVEDERKLAQVLESALISEHYEVVVAPTGEDGFFRANAESFDFGATGSDAARPARPRDSSDAPETPDADAGVDRDRT
jgi:CheY-like chemotaxis protein